MGELMVSWSSAGGSLAWRSAGGRVTDVDDQVEFKVAAKLENLAVVRTLVSAVGTFEDLDSDTVADLRLAVDEACTRLIRSSVPGASLTVIVRPLLDEVVIDAST